jgi:hypothetical protein
MNHLSEEAIFDYLHGVSAQTEREQAADHLRACESCRLLFERERAFELSLVTQRLEKAPSDLTFKVLSEITPSVAKAPVSEGVDRHAITYWLLVAAVAGLTVLLSPQPAAPGPVSHFLHDIFGLFASASDVLQSKTLFVFLIGGGVLWCFDLVLKRLFRTVR